MIQRLTFFCHSHVHASETHWSAPWIESDYTGCPSLNVFACLMYKLIYLVSLFQILLLKYCWSQLACALTSHFTTPAAVHWMHSTNSCRAEQITHHLITSHLLKHISVLSSCFGPSLLISLTHSQPQVILSQHSIQYLQNLVSLIYASFWTVLLGPSASWKEAEWKSHTKSNLNCPVKTCEVWQE